MALKPVVLLVSAVALLVAPISSAMATPPLDCRKAETPVERTMCASPEFTAMDREIAALYDRGLAALSGEERHQLAESQVAFIKRRSGCAWAAHHSAHPGPAIGECIRDKMETRLRALRSRVDAATHN